MASRSLRTRRWQRACLLGGILGVAGFALLSQPASAAVWTYYADPGAVTAMAAPRGAVWCATAAGP